jgi:hypothetical protein
LHDRWEILSAVARTGQTDHESVADECVLPAALEVCDVGDSRGRDRLADT